MSRPLRSAGSARGPLVAFALGAAGLTISACGPSTPRPASAANASGAASPGGASPGGAAASDFTLNDVEGRTVRLSDFQGKVVLIDFWATWCVPCEAEIPHLQELFEKDKDRGFVVLGISMDGPETVANVPSFVNRYNLTFPVLIDDETKVVGIYNPKRTAPLSILIDRTGKIARVRQGYNPGDETQIADDVNKALGPS